MQRLNVQYVVLTSTKNVSHHVAMSFVKIVSYSQYNTAYETETELFVHFVELT